MKSSKRKSFHSNLVAFIIVLALGITGLCLSLPSLLMLINGPKSLDTFDYNSMTQTDFEQAYVSGTINRIYDYYCDETQGDSLRAREYLIDGGDNYYMGMRVKKADLEPAEALLSASADYLSGVEDDAVLEAAQYTVKGTIKPMDSERIHILKEYLDYDTMDRESQDTILFYYLEVGSVGEYNMPTIIIFVILSVIFLVLAVWFLIRTVTGRPQKKVRP